MSDAAPPAAPSPFRRLLARPWLWAYVAAFAVFIVTILFTGGRSGGEVATAAFTFATFSVIVGIGQMFVVTLEPGNVDLSIPATITLAGAGGGPAADPASGRRPAHALSPAALTRYVGGNGERAMSTWVSRAEGEAEKRPPRSVRQAMLRGFACRCPACGKGRLFRGYLKVVDRCEACGEDLSHQRADDAPPYLTIFAVGHIIVPLILVVEMTWHLPDMVQIALWLPLTAILAIALLRPIKGAVVGLQWALYMHGFDPDGADDDVPAAWRPDSG